MYKSKYDRFDCAEKGYSTEQKFKTLLESQFQYKVEIATKSENIHDHIDLWFYSDKRYSVDVKSRKRLNRADADFQDDLIWIELKNVQGNDGWVYGKADYIAFEVKNGFLLCSRLKLVEKIEELKSKFYQDDSREKKPYKLYTRKDRKDLLTLLPIIDVKSISSLLMFDGY